MSEQTQRTDVNPEHISNCKSKLDTLLKQNEDLMLCYDQLHSEILDGKRQFKLYRQMKMYNDDKLNPQLYKKNQ